MSESRSLIFPLLAVMAVLAGCESRLQPREFLSRYEAQALVSGEHGDYRIGTLLETADYLVARQIENSGTMEGIDSMRSEFQSGIYVQVTLNLAHPTGKTEDGKYDLLNGSIANGPAAFSERFDFLERRLGSQVYLESPTQGRIPPRTYSFSRNYGMGTANSFLFVFPREYAGKHIDVEDCRIVLKDIGTGIGTVSRKLVQPRSISLKVAQ